MTQTHTKNIINQRYEILQVLGKGGMGTTYKAHDLETGSNIALKVIPINNLTNAKQLELLEREVDVLKKLNHPNIPSYLDYFDIGKDFYIAQQLADGKNLEEWVKQGWRVTEKEIKNIAIQILQVLAYLHSFDPPIIHRDIKPHNLIRSLDGKLFLVDFGAVQNVYYTTLMRGSTTVGTFGYMPLEQTTGKAVAASDLYSLGATLLYLLTRRSPHELSNGLGFDIRSHLRVSEEFADWLEKILEPDVDDRFSSATEALKALKNPQLVREGRLNKKRWLAWLGLGTATIAGMIFCDNYKGAISYRLGFPQPPELCKQERVTVEYLSSGGKIFQSHLIRCLLWAVNENNKEIVKLLVTQGADVNVQNQHGKTVLHWAISRGDKEIVELLIAHGAEFNAQTYNGYILLHEALRRGDKEIVELLIAHLTDINVKDHNGYTLLHKAVLKKDKEMIELLIAHGADLELPPGVQYTLVTQEGKIIKLGKPEKRLPKPEIQLKVIRQGEWDKSRIIIKKNYSYNPRRSASIRH